MVYDVNKGIPPKRLPRVVRTKYPFKTMGVGKYFFVPHKHKNTMAQYASVQSKKLNCTFRTRLVYMRETLQGWVLCEATAKGATIGIGVWRVA